MAALQPGETILSLELDHGGHLTHGHKVNFSGRLYTIAGYGVSRETNLVDYDEVLPARERAPAEADRLRRLRVSADGRGGQVPRDRRRGRCALLCDMAHFAGSSPRAPSESGRALRLRHVDDAQDARRPARRLHPLPRGARAGGRPRGLPRHAGRPARATIAAKATCFRIAMSDAFREYQRRSARTPTCSPRRCRRRPRILTGGTDTHLMQIDLREHRMDGQGRRGAPARGEDHRQPEHRAVRRAPADGRVGRAHRDAGDDDAASTRTTSARRARSSATRSSDAPDLDGAAPRVAPRCATKRPLYPGFRGYTTYASRLSAVPSDRLGSVDVEHPLVQHKLGYCARRTRRPSTSASSRTRSRCCSRTRRRRICRPRTSRSRRRSSA